MWSDFVDALTGIISNAWDKIGDWVAALIMLIINVLPDSPFKNLSMPTVVSNALGYINWVVPMQFIISSTSAWAIAIFVYYGYVVILRWMKAVK